MASTVVGLFKNENEAQNVKHDLIDQGYSAENIRVISANGQAWPAGAPSSSTKPAAAEPADTGFAATISNFFHSLTGSDPEDEKHYADGVRAGGAFLSVTVADDRAEATAALLERHGAKNVDEQSASKAAGLGANGQGKPLANTAGGAVGSAQKLEVVEEELNVGKRQVQRGGVRVYSHVTERPVEENITLHEEHVRVERRPVNRPATEADFQAFQEGAIELKETAEEAVVSKTSRVVEEVVIGTHVSERQQTVKDTVRRTDVTVEKIDAEQPGYGNYEPDYRRHFETNYAKSGGAYELYAPAYQYGHKLASDPQHAQSDWTKVESAARSDWSKHGSGTWEDMKDAVRQGWDKVTGTKPTAARQ